MPSIVTSTSTPSLPGRISNGIGRICLLVSNQFRALTNSNLVLACPSKMTDRGMQILGVGAFLSLIACVFYSRAACCPSETPDEEELDVNLDLTSWCNEKKGTPEYKKREEAKERILDVYNDEKPRRLFLDGLSLSSLPRSLGELSNLTFLSLNNNKLQSIPEELEKLFQLTHLRLSANQLQSIPATLKNLPKLTHLWLEGNKLKSVPEGVENLSNLTHLRLNHNELQSIPDGLENLFNLVHLDLESNKLRSVPATLGKLSRLVFLGLGSNELQSVPEGLAQLHSSCIIDLSKNPLENIQRELPSFKLEFDVN